ncbi:MAG: AAA family ATPase [Myxococcota bacterium]
MTVSTTERLRFTSIHLENWRNFTRVEVDLQQRAFLVGPNAAGKSNLLDAFRFLRDLVAIGGGFQEAVRRRGGVSSLRCLAARRYPDVAIRVAVGSDGAPHSWEYDLRIRQDNQRRPIVGSERVVANGKVLLDRKEEKERNEDPERLYQTHLEQVNVNREFRPIAEFFSSVRYLHLVPQLVREPDRSVGRSNDPYGGDFLEQIGAAQEKTRRARLRRMVEALKVAVPQLSQLEFERDQKGIPKLKGRYEHWRPQGAWQDQDQLSDGTLRLLGILWAALDGGGPLLLEEPELSLHPDVVRHLPQLLARIQRRSGRQVLVSTHSVDLLRDEGIGLDEVLLLSPHAEGTNVTTAESIDDAEELLQGGLSLAEIVMARTRPQRAEQLALFEAP